MKGKKANKKRQQKIQLKKRKSHLGSSPIKEMLTTKTTKENRLSKTQNHSKAYKKAQKRKNNNYKNRNLRKKCLRPMQRIRNQWQKRKTQKIATKLVSNKKEGLRIQEKRKKKSPTKSK